VTGTKGRSRVLLLAVQLDPVAEEVFRRLMALEGRIGRIDSIAATWRQLQRNLHLIGRGEGKQFRKKRRSQAIDQLRSR
jgi:hypothetical protein